MHISLDQLRALDAVATQGTMARAAAALRKRPSALVYALGQLELQSGLSLLDRSGYRTVLSPAGESFLEEARRILSGYEVLSTLCHTLRTGWEPSLRVVLDGIYPSGPVLRQVQAIRAAGAPTRVEVSVEYLAGVEEAFAQRRADLMISVLPPRNPGLVAKDLPSLRAFLVAGRDHPLARLRRATREDLAAHTLVTVRGSDPRLQLSTSSLEPAAPIQLHDFSSKREALLAGMGYGWMPAYIIADDLRRGRLRKLAYVDGAEHVFHPRVYAIGDRAEGRAAKRLISGLRADPRDEGGRTRG